MDESQMHDAKVKEPLKTNMLTYSICMRIWKRPKYRNRTDRWFPGVRVRGGPEYKEQSEEMLWGMGVCLYSVCGSYRSLGVYKNS